MSFETEEIKRRIDIVDFLSEYLELKPAGANFKGLCPFHGEKTPSFMVHRDRAFWHCFGCNKGGDVFTFLEEFEHLDFPEALEILAQRAGIELKKINRETYSLKERLLVLHEEAALFFERTLREPQGQGALRYLTEKRKITSADLGAWRIGYAPARVAQPFRTSQKKGFLPKEMKESGLVAENEKAREPYDRFRNRIIFPLTDSFNRVIGFTGRHLDETVPPKYLNSPQTLLYDKGHTIFGLFNAKEAIRKTRSVILMEGQMDVIASHRAGAKSAVAVSGTALTLHHLDILKRLTSTILFSFGADAAGIRASARGLELALSQGFFVKVIAIDPRLAKDPGELIEKDAPAWEKAAKGAIPFMDFLLGQSERFDRENIQTKKLLVARLARWIGKITDPVEQDHFAKKICQEFDVDLPVLRKLLADQRPSFHPSSEPAPRIAPTPAAPDMRSQTARRFLGLLLVTNDAFEHIPPLLAPEALPADERSLYKLLLGAYTTHSKDWSIERLTRLFSRESADISHTLHALLLLGEELKAALPSGAEQLAELKRLARRLQVDHLKTIQKNISKDFARAESAHEDTNARRLLVDLEAVSRERAQLEQEIG